MSIGLGLFLFSIIFPSPFERLFSTPSSTPRKDDPNPTSTDTNWDAQKTGPLWVSNISPVNLPEGVVSSASQRPTPPKAAGSTGRRGCGRGPNRLDHRLSALPPRQ